jgi:hypothetical protein
VTRRSRRSAWLLATLVLVWAPCGCGKYGRPIRANSANASAQHAAAHDPADPRLAGACQDPSHPHEAEATDPGTP